MTRLLIFLVIITFASIGAMWFIENDGSIVITWLGYRIQTSVAFSLLATIILCVAFTIVIQVLIWVVTAPKRFRKELTEKKRDKGLTALTSGFAAIAAGDTKNAKKLTKKARYCLGPIPLTKLLAAQTAQLEGNEQIATEHYTAMLENKETELVAIKGLLIQARKDGDLKKAEFLAEKALKILPDANWAVSILMDLYKLGKSWEKAEQITQLAYKKKIITSNEVNRTLSIINLAKSIECKNQEDNKNALKLAQKSNQLLPNFAPITEHLALLYIEQNETKKALKLIEQQWKTSPHPRLASIYIKTFSNEKNEKRVARIEKLCNLNPEHIESHILMARIDIETHQYGKARNHLKKALSENENSTICSLMAEIERNDKSDPDTVMKWEKRVTTAPPPPRWTCNICGYTAIFWSPNCPGCQSFDSLKWQDTLSELNDVSPKLTLKAEPA